MITSIVRISLSTFPLKIGKPREISPIIVLIKTFHNPADIDK